MPWVTYLSTALSHWPHSSPWTSPHASSGDICPQGGSRVCCRPALVEGVVEKVVASQGDFEEQPIKSSNCIKKWPGLKSSFQYKCPDRDVYERAFSPACRHSDFLPEEWLFLCFFEVCERPWSCVSLCVAGSLYISWGITLPYQDLSFHPQLPWCYSYMLWKHFKNCFWRGTCNFSQGMGRNGMTLFWMEPLMALEQDSDQQKASRLKKPKQVLLSCCRALCWNQQVLKKKM